MIKCPTCDIPCCDFCIFCIHGWQKCEDGHLMSLGPIGCKKYNDAEHNRIASGCGYCDDYICKNVDLVPKDAIMEMLPTDDLVGPKPTYLRKKINELPVI